MVSTLGSKTKEVETGFVVVNLLVVCGGCGNHDTCGDYPTPFEVVEGKCGGYVGLDVGCVGFIVDVGFGKPLFIEVVEIGGLDEKE